MHYLKWVTVVLLGLLTGIAAAQQTLTINTGDAPPLHTVQQTGFIDRVLKAAFQRLDIHVTILEVPAERSLINANAGIADGDSDRIAGLEKIYPNLLRVPEKIMDWNFVAFSKEISFQTNDWDSLQPYSVSFIRGWKIFEHNVVNAAVITPVKNVQQLFTLLMKNRADVALYDQWQGLAYIKQNRLNNIKLLTPVIVTKEKYLYLHKKHQHLVLKIALALKEIKADGTYQSLYQLKLAPLTSN